MRKKVILIIFLTICIIMPSCYAIPSTAEYQVIIEDDANLLTDEEEKKLHDIMGKLTEYGNALFKTININSVTTKTYASNYYHKKVGTESGTLFLIDMYNRVIYIFSDGSNYQIVTDAKAEIITDNVYKYASNKEYYECAEEAYNEILTLLQGKKIAEPMKYISNAILAIMFAVIINFIVFKSATKVKKAQYRELINGGENYFEYTPPKAVKTGQHREYSPQTDSSSGGSSSGGGGGGGSSGGGGGHSF